MRGLKRPVVTPTPVEPYTAQEISKLLAACEGWSFRQLRDTAIIKLLAGAGVQDRAGRHHARQARLRQQVITVLGKGAVAAGGG